MFFFQIFTSPEDFELIKDQKEREKKMREAAAGNPEIERVKRLNSYVLNF